MRVSEMLRRLACAPTCLTALGAVLLTIAPSACIHAASRPPTYGSHGLDTTAIDPAVHPGDDFWAYANGEWAKRAHFHDNQEIAGVAVDYNMMADARTAGVIDRPEFLQSRDPDQRKLAVFYASWLDTAGTERLGRAPLQPYLASIGQVKTTNGLAALFGTAGFASPFEFGVDPAPSDARRNEVVVSGGALGMALRYYLEQGATYEANREAYLRYVERILDLGGVATPARKARAILDLETRLARAQSTGSADSDTLIPAGALGTQVPEVDWLSLMSHQGLAKAQELRLRSGETVRALAKIVAGTPLDIWKDYLTFRFVSDHADYLPSAFATARADFYDRTLAGLKAPRDRKVQGIRLVEGAMPEAVSRLYQARYFDPVVEKEVTEIFENVKASYADLVERNAWMDEATRRAAREKVAALTACIGGPELHTDFSDLSVFRGDLLGNVVRSESKRVAVRAASLKSPVQACRRYGFAQRGNDYYVREENTVLLPSGSLIPPFFDPSADPAVNYGAIGVTIAHEIGHGFDVDGAEFDAHGERKNWWSERARSALRRKMDDTRAQYSTMEILPGLHVDGGRTLGENMADLMGTQAAFMAYEKRQERHGEAPTLDGFTGEQRFFLSVAQMRRTQVREESLRFLALSDTHTPPRQRINGVMRNVDAWYQAFSVRRSDSLYLPPAQRIQFW